MKKNHRRSSHGRSNQITTVTGSYLLATSIGSTSPASVLLNPSVFPRATAVAAAYENYRYTHFMIHMLPLNIVGGVNGAWVLGFSSDVAATLSSLASEAEVSECTPSGIQSISGSASVSTSADLRTGHFSIGKHSLITDTSLKWWKCTGDGGTNNWENYQAMLIFYNPFASTQIYTIFVHYRIEFASPISTLLTLTALQRKRTAPIPSLVHDSSEDESDLPSITETVHSSYCPCKSCKKVILKGRPGKS